MNKNLIYVLVTIVLLVLLGGAGYLFLTNTTTPAAMMADKPQVVVDTPQTLTDLLALGESQKCSYQDQTEKTNVRGVTYIAAGKIRSDFITSVSGQETGGHMLLTNSVANVWMDGQKTGFKMALDTIGDTTVNTEASKTVDLNKAMNFKCEPWTVDEKVFTLPGGVSFSELPTSKMSPDDKESASGAANSQCVACSYLTGEEKAQCLVALKCN